MKILVIAEKPDMGRNIAAAMEPKAVNKRTYLEGTTYIITWAIGHLVSLAEPERYDDKYKRWNFSDLPIIPESFKLEPNPRTKEQLKQIGQLAARCGTVVNACDAGREGQLIFAYIQQYLRLVQPVWRLWISDLTPETIRRGFAALKDAAEYEHLTKAARARSEADWLIGMNSSRAFTTRHRVLLSSGRVQTPVLALIYERQKQIESFDKLVYYDVVARFVQEGAAYEGIWQGERLTEQAKAEALARKVEGKLARIVGYESKDSKEYPFRLYDLTMLQRDANARYGLSAKKTLELAQSLYEKHKVISYPRTNSNYVTEQNIPDMHRALASLKGTVYEPLAAQADRSKVHKGNAMVCNPQKVEDHHAIIPTGKKPGTLSDGEQKIYDLIIRRLLAQYFPPAQYKLHTVMTEVEREMFKTSVKQLLSPGWKVVYAEIDKARRKQPDAVGEQGEEPEETKEPFHVDPQLATRCEHAEAKRKETQPPKPYTEGTLLKAMESAGKQIENEELREAMKDAGLGTPATRAATIERLKTVGYIEGKGKSLFITAKGRMAVELIRAAGVELLTSPEMTGHWERRLNEIARGTASPVLFMDNVKKFARLIVDKVREQERANVPVPEEKPVSRGKKSAQRQTAPRNAAAEARAETKATAKAKVAEPIGACPRTGCGGQIIVGRKGYGCSRYADGCRFIIWKETFGKTLSVPMVRSILQKGRTSKLKFQDKAGQPFQASLVLQNKDTAQLGLERS